MKSNQKYVSFFLLLASILFTGCASLKEHGPNNPVKLPEAEDAEIIMVISKGGKVNFVGANNKELRKIHIGEKRPINIEKLLPGKVIKTIDQVLIFTGSPACVNYDGWLICD